MSFSEYLVLTDESIGAREQQRLNLKAHTLYLHDEPKETIRRHIKKPHELTLSPVEVACFIRPFVLNSTYGRERPDSNCVPSWSARAACSRRRHSSDQNLGVQIWFFKKLFFLLLCNAHRCMSFWFKNKSNKYPKSFQKIKSDVG